MQPCGTSSSEPAWPTSPAALMDVQDSLAEADPPAWQPPAHPAVGACYCCFARQAAVEGREPGWAAATRSEHGRRAVVATVRGRATASYRPGLLALREGPLRCAAARALPAAPDVLLVDATGRDHPRRAGLALHLGAVLDVPTVGVTDRPLTAGGEQPAALRGAFSPLRLAGETVGYWLCTRTGVQPVAVHAAWRTSPEVAVEIVHAAARKARTPQPLREARRAARAARAADGG